MKRKLTLIFFLTISIYGTAIAGNKFPTSILNLLLLSDTNKETVTSVVIPGQDTVLQLTDGTGISIPKNLVQSGTKIKLTKYHDSSFIRLEPEGLTTSSDMTLHIPVESYMKNDNNKIVVGYVYSNESPLHNSGSEQIKAEKIYLKPSSELVDTNMINVNINHFSLFRFS